MVEDLSSHEEQPDDGAVAEEVVEEGEDVSNTSALRDCKEEAKCVLLCTCSQG
jgi:hypothetical protein